MQGGDRYDPRPCTALVIMTIVTRGSWPSGRAGQDGANSDGRNNLGTQTFTPRKRIRKSFGRIPEVAPMPNLIDVQRSSYEGFLQMHIAPDSRTNTGLQEVFRGVFPIDDFAGRGRLEFVYYELEDPKYDVEECIQRGMNYAAPLKVISAPDRMGRGRRHRSPLYPRHQGTARLHGRHASNDG